MADEVKADSPELAALKEQVARANAERDLAQAQLDKLKATADAQAAAIAAEQAAWKAGIHGSSDRKHGDHGVRWRSARAVATAKPACSPRRPCQRAAKQIAQRDRTYRRAGAHYVIYAGQQKADVRPCWNAFRCAGRDRERRSFGHAEFCQVAGRRDRRDRPRPSLAAPKRATLSRSVP